VRSREECHAMQAMSVLPARGQSSVTRFWRMLLRISSELAAGRSRPKQSLNILGSTVSAERRPTRPIVGLLVRSQQGGMP